MKGYVINVSCHSASNIYKIPTKNLIKRGILYGTL